MSLVHAIILVLVVATNCLAQDATQSPTLRIGVIAPLSGPFADYGIATRNGIAMAQSKEENPSSVKFVFEDSQYDAKMALSAFQKLREVDQVSLVFNWGTGTSQAIAPVAEGKRFPLIVQTTELSLNQGKQFVIRLGIRAEDYSAALLSYFRAHGIKRIGIVADEVVFFREVITGLHRLAQVDETITDYETFAPSDTDFKSILLKLRNEDFQILGAFVTSSQITPFFSQKEQLGLRVPVFGMNTFDSRTDIARVGKFMKGAVYPTLAVTPEFREEYLKRFGNDVQLPFAALGHDFARLLFSLPDLVTAKDGSELLQALKSVHAFTGATGRVEFGTSKDSGPEFRVPVALQRITETGVESLLY